MEAKQKNEKKNKDDEKINNWVIPQRISSIYLNFGNITKVQIKYMWYNICELYQ